MSLLHGQFKGYAFSVMVGLLLAVLYSFVLMGKPQTTKQSENNEPWKVPVLKYTGNDLKNFYEVLQKEYSVSSLSKVEKSENFTLLGTLRTDSSGVAVISSRDFVQRITEGEKLPNGQILKMVDVDYIIFEGDGDTLVRLYGQQLAKVPEKKERTRRAKKK